MTFHSFLNPKWFDNSHIANNSEVVQCTSFHSFAVDYIKDVECWIVDNFNYKLRKQDSDNTGVFRYISFIKNFVEPVSRVLPRMFQHGETILKMGYVIVNARYLVYETIISHFMKSGHYVSNALTLISAKKRYEKMWTTELRKSTDWDNGFLVLVRQNV